MCALKNHCLTESNARQLFAVKAEDNFANAVPESTMDARRQLTDQSSNRKRDFSGQSRGNGWEQASPEALAYLENSSFPRIIRPPDTDAIARAVASLVC